jgi:hypothetical protein
VKRMTKMAKMKQKIGWVLLSVSLFAAGGCTDSNKNPEPLMWTGEWVSIEGEKNRTLTIAKKDDEAIGFTFGEGAGIAIVDGNKAVYGENRKRRNYEFTHKDGKIIVKDISGKFSGTYSRASSEEIPEIDGTK